MCDLIVNGDDFGLSEKVNEGILKAHLNGILTSASIMANGLAFEHAINICQSYPTLDVGVHLTLVEEKPLLGVDMVASLVNEEGRFHDNAIRFMKRYMMGRIHLEEVQRELEAQIKRVLSHGIRVNHLDSHQHLHVLPKILVITVELGKKYNIPSVRFPRETAHIGMLTEKRAVSRFLQLLVLNWFCRFGRYIDMARTEHFAGFLFAGNLNKTNLQKLLRYLPSTGVCELMCHPGLDDPDTCYRHWEYRWAEELNALIDPEIKSLLNCRNIELMSYKKIGAGQKKNL